jgi:hypothetical protein
MKRLSLTQAVFHGRSLGVPIVLLVFAAGVVASASTVGRRSLPRPSPEAIDSGAEVCPACGNGR